MASTIPGGRYLVNGRFVNANGEPLPVDPAIVESTPVADVVDPSPVPEKPLTAAQKRAAAKAAAALEAGE